MVKISRQSKKEELWSEVERLRQASDQARNRSAILQSETAKLRAENERLQERTRFVEELSERARATNEKLEILTSLTKELASFDLDGVLEVCVQRIPFLVGARYASVYLYDRAGQRLVLKHHTHDREINHDVELSENPDSLMAVAIRDKRTLCIDDVGHFMTNDGQTPNRPHEERYQTSSCVVAPLIAAGEVEGVLNLADRFDNRPFDAKGQLGLIRQACELLAVSLRNARLFDAVQQAARSDSLTGLINRQFFLETLGIEVKRAHRYENQLSTVGCRIEGLALINSNHGHRTGDQIIQAVGQVLAGNVRDVDIVGRTGGTEFGIILPEQTLEGALVVARRLATKMSEARFPIGDLEQSIQATFGVAQYQRVGSGAELFQSALEILATAREAGEPVGWKE